MDSDWLSLNRIIDPGTGLGAISLAVLIVIIAWVACIVTTRLIRRANWVMGRFKRQVDETVVRYLVRIKNLLLFLIAALFYASLVPSLRALMGTMVAGAGITALVVGFAAKSTLANLISGISLAIYRPIRIGDNVSIEGEYTTVEDITLRHTIVRTWQHKRLIIPNAKLDEMTLVNYSIIDPKMRCTVDFGVSYDTDIDLARRLILEEADRCPNRDKKADAPVVRVISHGDFSIGLRLYMWVPKVDDFFLGRFWILEHVKKRFDKEGVEIPFPYRTLVYKKDLPPPRTGEPVSGDSD
jgi:small conductance mechanosensitive channel